MKPLAWTIAEKALAGVGDAEAGEWREVGSVGPGMLVTVHLRRRLSAAEMEEAGLTGVRDVRGTSEEVGRLVHLVELAPHLGPLIAGLRS